MKTRSTPRPRARLIPLVAGSMSAVVLAGCSAKTADTSTNPTQNATATTVELTVSTNAIAGGKSAAEADWITSYVIPKFVEAQKDKGVTATVKFVGSGVADEQYKSKMALDLKSKSGSDIIALDGIWVGEFAEAGYIAPLDKTVGASANDWDGWKHIPEAVQRNASYDGKRYGIPMGTDGRVLYFNKKLFAQAGLPADWQPKSWDDIVAAGESLKKINGVTPIQINAGTAMGEATTMQGALPLLVGTGTDIYADGKWQGNTSHIRDVLGFYKKLIDSGLADRDLQLAAKGRDESFADFAAGKIGILAEGDYFWRSVIEPVKGEVKMASRNTDVGFAKIPAMAPGKGVRGQDFVSMSGGGGYFVNPNTKYPQQTWELLTFMTSPDAIKAQLAGQVRITARDDVNAQILAGDPLLSMVSSQVLPLTSYRPGYASYPQVSQALQQATADIVSGKSVADAAAAYQAALVKIAGADKVSSS